MTDININDIKSVLSIIDVCTQRGAIKSVEMEDVGKLYNKLTLFLNTSLEQIKKQAGQTEQANVEEPQKENTSSDENGGHSMEFNQIKTI